MSLYKSTNCPICGNYVRVYTDRQICEKCGYQLPSSTPVTTVSDKTGWVSHSPLKKNNNNNTETNTSTQIVDDSNKNVGGLYGWICPKCGAVLSPFTSCCPNCTRRNWEITCNTGGSNL